MENQDFTEDSTGGDFQGQEMDNNGAGDQNGGDSGNTTQAGPGRDDDRYVVLQLYLNQWWL